MKSKNIIIGLLFSRITNFTSFGLNKIKLSLLKKQLVLFIIMFFSLSIVDTYAQDCTNYIFSDVSGSYSPISGTTIHGAGVDDAGASITLPFSFNYCGTAYAYLTVSSNGYTYLTNSITTTSTWSNSLNSSSYQNVLAPFWDDLKTGTSGSVVWTTTGTSPNRVITIQWSNLQWYYSNTTNFVNFQLKLYETSNAIEFIYGSMGSSPGTSASASIGINDYVGSSTHYQSITPTSTDALASIFTENSSIVTNTGLSNGTTFRFVPPMMYVPKSNANVYYACSGTLYDNGGLSLSYDNNDDGLAIIYPSDFSKLVQLSGSIVGEGGYDFVTIYDGAGTSGSVLFGGSAHSSGTSCISTSIPLLTSTVGPLTVKFHSDGSNVCTGLTLNVGCSTPSSVTPAYDGCGAIYVSASSGKDYYPGTPDYPVFSIKRAMNLVTSSRKYIKIAQGSYTEAEKINMSDGLIIEGGYVVSGNNWTKSSDAVTNLHKIIEFHINTMKKPTASNYFLPSYSKYISLV